MMLINYHDFFGGFLGVSSRLGFWVQGLGYLEIRDEGFGRNLEASQKWFHRIHIKDIHISPESLDITTVPRVPPSLRNSHVTTFSVYGSQRFDCSQHFCILLLCSLLIVVV